MLVDATFAAPGRFWKGNLHTHSTRSDAARDPEVVCALYRDAGYDFLALTDHFLPAFGFPIVDTRGFRTNRFTTILGAEVHAPATEIGELWHLLAVGLPLDFARTPPSERAAELAARCIAAGAYVAIAHPAWYALTESDVDSITAAHALEIYNHTSEVKVRRGDSSSLCDVLLSKGRRFSLCATDDAHFHIADWFGGWVMVKAETLEPEALIEALKSGLYYSSQGPLIHGIAASGDVLEVECSPASAIMALGRGSASACTVGTDITRARLPIAALKSGFARVVIVDERGRKAWSNPLWW
ncbi:MAG TPA: phosphotransferase [Hyphomicrobiaceae bacterium]|jgi:histidinol phosphatase-like PHP family hydrolase|nr:phosphotransferase [Hyphomicrobiaceae bacterium]